MADRPVRFRVVVSEDGMMLVKLVARRLRTETVDAARELVKAGGVYVGKNRVRIPTVRLVPGERVTVYPNAADVPSYEPDQLVFVHRDPQFVVLDKPAGVPVSATRASARGTLSDALIRRLEAEGVDRPYVGVVHRLDRGASGLVIFTIRGAANRSIHRQFEEHGIARTYRLLVEGHAPDTAVCDAPLIERSSGHVVVAREGEPSGKPAHTDFARLGVRGERTLLEARLATGRTHQIRVHAAELGFPIVGDTRYGESDGAGERLHLHAHALRFEHPGTGQPIELVSDPPAWADWADAPVPGGSA